MLNLSAKSSYVNTTLKKLKLKSEHILSKIKIRTIYVEFTQDEKNKRLIFLKKTDYNLFWLNILIEPSNTAWSTFIKYYSFVILGFRYKEVQKIGSSILIRNKEDFVIWGLVIRRIDLIINISYSKTSLRRWLSRKSPMLTRPEGIVSFFNLLTKSASVTVACRAFHSLNILLVNVFACCRHLVEAWPDSLLA
ncbi:hypothetical protein BpHYR1_019159 [Brachionus plicatilis]|uniref:Uncharacterized protein n=1 Tax=Brachionus plicatilis TaxID=10195 RepID=A0A3M7RWN8_BRAPC|nr:hypothetical protein BpHYR1_019159 [Brachionus plicatilis]